jgi:hypothetical protein
MGLIDNIKKEAQGNRTKIQSTEAATLEKILNRTFFLDKNIEEETKFVKQVMTRGLESQERVGLHASAMLVGDKEFCLRAQVLSLIYKQLQGGQIAVGLKRIFEEGNAIHEKWQRLFIRAGYGKAKHMDFTRMCNEYMLSYTPDIDCKIPEFFEGRMIGEIKSVNTFQFQRMTKHPSAWKQCQWYMYLCIKELKDKGKWNGVDYTKGFVLNEDKNTQDFKLEVYDYDPTLIEPYADRAESIVYHYERVFEEHKMVKRPTDAKSPDCKRCRECFMREACWNIGNGKIRIGG